MFLPSDHGSESDAETGPVKANIRSIYDRLPGDRRLEVVIRGANHYGFSDGAMLKSPLVMSALHTLEIVPLDGRRQVAVTSYFVHTFFDIYLKGAPASELSIQSKYPKVQYAP